MEYYIKIINDNCLLKKKKIFRGFYIGVCGLLIDYMIFV